MPYSFHSILTMSNLPNPSQNTKDSDNLLAQNVGGCFVGFLYSIVATFVVSFLRVGPDYWWLVIVGGTAWGILGLFQRKALKQNLPHSLLVNWWPVATGLSALIGCWIACIALQQSSTYTESLIVILFKFYTSLIVFTSLIVSSTQAILLSRYYKQAWIWIVATVLATAAPTFLFAFGLPSCSCILFIAPLGYSFLTQIALDRMKPKP